MLPFSLPLGAVRERVGEGRPFLFLSLPSSWIKRDFLACLWLPLANPPNKPRVGCSRERGTLIGSWLPSFGRDAKNRKGPIPEKQRPLFHKPGKQTPTFSQFGIGGSDELQNFFARKKTLWPRYLLIPIVKFALVELLLVPWRAIGAELLLLMPFRRFFALPFFSFFKYFSVLHFLSLLRRSNTSRRNWTLERKHRISCSFYQYFLPHPPFLTAKRPLSEGGKEREGEEEKQKRWRRRRRIKGLEEEDEQGEKDESCELEKQ